MRGLTADRTSVAVESLMAGVRDPVIAPGPLGLYVHVPFCVEICNYCSFNRGLLDEPLKARYVTALEREISRAGVAIRADTIYFGGGTPSVLEPAEIARLIDVCRGSFDLVSTAEITVELNPETATVARLAGYREAGVNRLSIGVQSFRDAELRRLGRVHTADGARQASGLARAVGFDDVSLDLMMWLPDQTIGHWQESVEVLIQMAPDHASLYLLELYPNAPLRGEMARGGWSLAPDEDAADMYLWALARLDAAGYQQYEISNVARAGKRSRHNVKYWTDGRWLGFGCGAHSTSGERRWKNVSGAEEYVSRIEGERDPTGERWNRPAAEQLADALFMGLRLVDGIDLSVVERRYGVDVRQRHGPALAPFVDVGLLVEEPGRLRLTREGMLVANEIMSLFV